MMMTKKKRSDPTRNRRHETPRSLRPRQQWCLAGDDELDLEYEEERETEGRRKLKLVLKLPPFSAVLNRRHVEASGYATSSSDEEEEVEVVKPRKKRRIERVGDLESKKNVIKRPIRAVSGTPLPGKKTLEAILDKLQKKDTYGVFAEPVNLEELPDYHDVVEHPMDFGTVRRNLAGGRYRIFEQFEDDVFLICSNAMQYNAPNTIYFRQAHSIQDMARKNFQEIRADLISGGGERKSVENIRSVPTQKNTVKRLQSGMTPIASGFDMPSLEKKTLKQPPLYRNALEPLRHDISSMKKKIRNKQYRIAPEPPKSFGSAMKKETPMKPMCRTNKTCPEPSGSDISSMEKTTSEKTQYITKGVGSDISSVKKMTLEKPLYRTKRIGFDVSSMDKKPLKKHHSRSKWLGSDISSMENATLKKPRCGNEQIGSDISSMDKKTQKKPQNRTEWIGSDISSMEKMAPKKLQNRTERTGSGISSMEKTTLKKPQCKTERLSSGISSMEKTTLKKPQCITDQLGFDISSMEKMTLKKLQCRSESEPIGSDISSDGKKMQKEHQSRTTPESLDSDNSSGATLASAADTFTDFSKIPANASASTPDTCFGLTTVKATSIEISVVNNGSEDGSSFLSESILEKADEVPAAGTFTDFSKIPANASASTPDTCFGLTTVKATSIERSVGNNGSEDGSSFLGESKSEKADEVPAKCSPSKLELQQFIVDVSRRTTYNTLEEQPVVETDSLLDVFESEPRQLVTVGINCEYSYARSLSRFAAFLGPIGWEIASKKIEQSLPPGVKFGPGWVGNYEPLSTPSLSLQTNTKQQLPVTSEDKRNEIKSATTRISQHKDLQFARKSQVTTKMPSNILSSHSNEERDRTREKKQGPFGFNLELQQKKNNQPAGNLSKAYATKTAHNRLEPQNLQQKNNQTAGDLVMAYTNELTRHQSQLCFETRTVNIPAVNYAGTSHVKTEPLKEPTATMSQRKSDHFGTNGINGGDLSNIRSSDSRQNTPFGIISNHQAGVQHWFAHCNQQQAINKPVRLMSTFGKLVNHPKTSSRCNNNLEQSMPTVQIPKRAGSVSFNSLKKTSSPGSRVNEAAKIKSEPVEVEGVMQNFQAQTKGLIFPQLMTNDLSRLQAPWQGLIQRNKQKDMFPPDLNISFQPPRSPARSSFDSQQPDLALQL